QARSNSTEYCVPRCIAVPLRFLGDERMKAPCLPGEHLRVIQQRSFEQVHLSASASNAAEVARLQQSTQEQYWDALARNEVPQDKRATRMEQVTDADAQLVQSAIA